MATISIIGTGWLGLPLANYLSSLDHNLFASKTTLDGCNATQSQVPHVNMFVAKLSADIQSQAYQELQSNLVTQQPNIIIGAFPPGFRQGKGEDYIAYWQQLVSIAKTIPNVKLVMISSTAVYPSQAQLMDEDMASWAAYKATPESFSAKSVAMLKAEQTVIDSGLNYAIVRCSGLIGKQRLPHRFVRHLKQVSHFAPANMLHLNDAIGVIEFACFKLQNEVVNASIPDTLSKADFYQASIEAMQKLDCYHEDWSLSLPPLSEHKDKQISSAKITNLGYEFQFPTYSDLLAHLYNA